MRTLVLLLSLLLLPLQVLAEGRVAIFDYDRRNIADPGVAPYLEQQLRSWDPA